MKSRLALVLFACLGVVAEAADVAKPATAFEALLRRPTTQVLWSGEIVRIPAGESLAVITALKVKDPAEWGAIGMGFRVELTRGGVRREIHLGGIETRMFTIGVLMLNRVARPAPGQAEARYAGSPDFMDGEYGLLLGAHYARANETGAALAVRGDEGWYHFPGRKPQEFADAFQRGWRELGQHAFAHDEGWNPGPSRGQPPEGPTAVQGQNLNFYLIAVPPTRAPATPPPPSALPGQSDGGRGGAQSPTTFAENVAGPGARIASSEEIARLEAGGALALFTALRIQPAAPGAAIVPGIKVELSEQDSWVRAEVFLGAEEIAIERQGLRGIIEGLPRHLEMRAAGRLGSGFGYFGAAEFWMPRLPLLNVAYYSRPADETGVALGAFRGDTAYYHFPGKTTEEVQQVIEKGARLLGLP